MSVGLEDPCVGDGFVGTDIFIEFLHMLEVFLRSCCCRSTFDICMVHLVFFMVCGDGCILRTYGVLGKGVVYAFIWHVILGVRMVHFYVMVYS